jgi:hypothetical protein
LQAYGSDPFNYDFVAALKNAGSSRETTRSTTYGYGRPTKSKHGKVIDSPVTLETLKRHAKRYGMEGVAETAKTHGLNDGELLELGVAGTTADRVKALLGQGLVANEIAKRLRLGLPTVRIHMREVA